MWWWLVCFWFSFLKFGKYGLTAAHEAAMYDATGEKLKAIVEACPDCIDVQADDGRTPLHQAAYYGNDKCVNVLASAGCNLLIKNKSGGTAYDRAVDNGKTSTAALIKS